MKEKRERKYRITFLADYKDEESQKAVKKDEVWIIFADSEDDARGSVYFHLPDLWTPLGPKVSWMIRRL